MTSPRRRLLLLGMSLAICSGCAPATVPAPTSYASYNAKTGAFSCDYPEGWEVTGGGRSEMYNASFKKGSVSISVKADLAGSLMAGPQTNTGDLPPELRPEAGLHEKRQARVAEEISGYQEQDPVPIENPLGRGMQSEFNAAGPLGAKIRGYRVTLLSHDMCITVICQAPEAQWETLKPAFDKVINSLGPGRKE